MIQRQWTDFAQGLLEPTNNPLDFGLSGKGFFVVQGPSGPLYTRNGNFRFSNTGALVTNEGYPLLQQNGQPFKANTCAAVGSVARMARSARTENRSGASSWPSLQIRRDLPSTARIISRTPPVKEPADATRRANLSRQRSRRPTSALRTERCAL